VVVAAWVPAAVLLAELASGFQSSNYRLSAPGFSGEAHVL